MEGKVYTGMKVGRNHKWYYDKGEWKEKKNDILFVGNKLYCEKNKAGKAPKGSRVPVGTEYH